VHRLLPRALLTAALRWPGALLPSADEADIADASGSSAATQGPYPGPGPPPAAAAAAAAAVARGASGCAVIPAVTHPSGRGRVNTASGAAGMTGKAESRADLLLGSARAGLAGQGSAAGATCPVSHRSGLPGVADGSEAQLLAALALSPHLGKEDLVQAPVVLEPAPADPELGMQ
jgi:hypothetical protein